MVYRWLFWPQNRVTTFKIASNRIIFRTVSGTKFKSNTMYSELDSYSRVGLRAYNEINKNITSKQNFYRLYFLTWPLLVAEPNFKLVPPVRRNPSPLIQVSSELFDRPIFTFK